VPDIPRGVWRGEDVCGLVDQRGPAIQPGVVLANLNPDLGLVRPDALAQGAIEIHKLAPSLEDMGKLALEDPQYIALQDQCIGLREAPRGSVVCQLVDNPLPHVDVLARENPREYFLSNPALVGFTLGLGAPQPQGRVRGRSRVEFCRQNPVLDRGIGLAPSVRLGWLRQV
jgi:hypothetical protein